MTESLEVDRGKPMNLVDFPMFFLMWFKSCGVGWVAVMVAHKILLTAFPFLGLTF